MFDIIVPTYNRYYSLANFFDKISILDKNIYTLWLIDDCSTQVDVSVIPNWDNINFIQLPKNIGQAGARNYAIDNGVAPYIISLDDDAWFVSDSANLESIGKAFTKFSDAGCLMFNIATPKTTFKNNIDGQLLPLHVTCGCAYRREALEEINGFNSIIQGQGEESDISLKLYSAGWNIRSLYSVHVYHDFNPDSRSIEWYLKIRYKETRNCLIVAFIHYPLLSVFVALPAKAANQLIFAFKAKIAVWATFSVSIKAIIEFVTMIPELKKLRKPLSAQKFKKWRSLNEQLLN